jgi:hypothetical protein
MLMTGSRRHLLAEAVQDVESILKSFPKSTCTSTREEGKSSDVSSHPRADACKLSDELMQLQPDGTGWEVMYRVWLGMLCYSASRGGQKTRNPNPEPEKPDPEPEKPETRKPERYIGCHL